MSLLSIYTADEILRVVKAKKLDYDEVQDDVMLACTNMVSQMWDAVRPQDNERVFTFLLTLLLLGIEIGLNLPNKPNFKASTTYH